MSGKPVKEVGKNASYAELPSPIGNLTVVGTSDGICLIEFGSFADRSALIYTWLNKHFADCRLVRDETAMKAALEQLQQYFAGERKEFSLPLDLRGTPFQQAVWQALTAIPYGQTWSYKQVGVHIGQPKAVRAVGGANNRNPVPIIVPCHRVIGADGKLVGYGGGLDVKVKLLELEQGKGQGQAKRLTLQ